MCSHSAIPIEALPLPLPVPRSALGSAPMGNFWSWMGRIDNAPSGCDQPNLAIAEEYEMIAAIQRTRSTPAGAVPAAGSGAGPTVDMSIEFRDKINVEWCYNPNTYYLSRLTRGST